MLQKFVNQSEIFDFKNYMVWNTYCILKYGWKFKTITGHLRQVATYAVHVDQTCSSLKMAKMYGRNM